MRVVSISTRNRLLPSNCSTPGLGFGRPLNHRDVDTDRRAGLIREESDEGKCT